MRFSTSCPIPARPDAPRALMDDIAPDIPDGGAAAMTEQIVDRFGGIRPMAAKLDVPVTTVQGWKKRGVIPVARHPDILSAAARSGIAIDPAELAQTDPGGVAGRVEPRPGEVAGEVERERPVEPAPRGRRSLAAGAALGISIIALVGLVAAAGAAWQFYLRPLQQRTTALEARIAAIEPLSDLARRVDVLEAELARQPTGGAAAAPSVGAAGSDSLSGLAQDVAQLKADSARADQLAKRLADIQIATGGRELLAQSIRDIQSSVAASQGEVERLSAALQAADGRLDQVEGALAERRQRGLRAEAVALAAGQLRAALRTAKPFAEELASLRAVAGNDQQIDAVIDGIEPLGSAGVPTRDDLRGDLGRLAPDIVRSAVVGDGSSWWRQALYRFESVISLRRTGASVPGDRADALVARAEARLDEDDLDAAVTALRGLTGLPAQIAAPWVQQAEQRQAVDSAEAELSRLAIGRVAADNPQGPAPVSTPAPAPAPTPAPATPSPSSGDSAPDPAR
jgi:hypothetical protein